VDALLEEGLVTPPNNFVEQLQSRIQDEELSGLATFEKTLQSADATTRLSIWDSIVSTVSLGLLQGFLFWMRSLMLLLAGFAGFVQSLAFAFGFWSSTVAG